MNSDKSDLNLCLKLVKGKPVDTDGNVLSLPEGWVLLAPGDAGLTRRVKKHGRFWLLQEKKGRKTFSQGIFAPAAVIERERGTLEKERNSDGYKKRLTAQRNRRDKQQDEYVEEFRKAVLLFLNFDAKYHYVAEKLAEAVTKHATPVGSGTVGRTSRIPVNRRASSAVVAWLRHQTTSYDRMSIARVKGQRMVVRKMLASKSLGLLEGYRRGDDPEQACPLLKALQISLTGGE